MNACLAFDTATEHLSIAVHAHGRSLVHEAPGGAQASAVLVPASLALLERAGVRLCDLDAIAFGRGPGAFTGLRTACSVAQGFALGAGKPVLPIDTLLAIAEDSRAGRPDEACVWVVMDARMDEIYAAQYRYAAGAWSVLDAPMLTDPATLNRRWLTEAPQRIVGNALTAFGDRLVGGDAQRDPNALPRASAMLVLAQALWARGGAVDAALALPLYLRDKVAQTTLERAAARSAKDAAERSR